MAWLTAGLLVFGALSAGAQTPPEVSTVSKGDIPFFADAVSLIRSDGKLITRTFVDIPYTALRFSRQGNGWVARFDITLLIYDRGGNQLNGDLWTVPLRSSNPDQEQLRDLTYSRSFDMEVPPGKARVQVKVSQSGSGRQGVWESWLDIPRYDLRPLSLSDLVFGTCDSTADSAGTGRFSPTPRRRYGDARPILCVYGEVYDHAGAPDSSYSVSYEIADPGGKVYDHWTDLVPRKEGRGHFVLHPSIAGLTLGTYRLRVNAALGTEKIRRESPFEIDESRVDLFKDAQMIRQVLTYVATNDEIVRLENLPNDSLEVFWNDFWTRRDPTPDTPVNENLVEFLRRVAYANSHFGVLESGYSSDMGRVYIRFGPPEEVDRLPFTAGSPPQEIWNYFSRGIRFVFVDSEGFGRYRLVGTQHQ